MYKNRHTFFSGEWWRKIELRGCSFTHRVLLVIACTWFRSEFIFVSWRLQIFSCCNSGKLTSC